MDSGVLALKWNNHKDTFFKTLSKFRSESLHTDVIMACGSEYFNAHKIVLSSCSDYFQELFSKTHCKYPVIVLKDIRPSDMEALLSYMYVGEVEVKQAELSQLIKAAECLQIKGLTASDDDKVKEGNKRKRLTEEDSTQKCKQPKNSESLNENNAFCEETTVKSDEELVLKPSSIPKIKLEPIDGEIVTVEPAHFLEKSESNLEEADVGDNVTYDAEYFQESSLNEEPLNATSSDDPSSTLQLGEEINEEMLYTGDFLEGTKRLKVYKCRCCSYITKKISHMKSHITVHSGEKPFSCSKCDFRTGVQSNLNRHVKTHNEGKPYRCEYCQYTTRQKSAITSHMRLKHGV